MMKKLKIIKLKIIFLILFLICGLMPAFSFGQTLDDLETQTNFLINYVQYIISSLGEDKEPNVLIIYPLNNDVWYGGLNYNIEWKSFNMPSDVWVKEINLYQNDNFLQPLVSDGKYNISDSFLWTVPNNLIGNNNFQIELVFYKKTGENFNKFWSVKSDRFSILNYYSDDFYYNIFGKMANILNSLQNILRLINNAN